MKQNMWIWAAAAVIAAAGANSWATTTYDTTLASPNANPANNSTNLSWYDGSGNQNSQGGFTVDTENGIEIGMRAKYRQNPAVIDSSTDVYNVVPGAQTNVTSGGNGAAPTRAAWNYEFSIDLQPGGPTGGGSGLTMADISANTTLTITDLTTSQTATVDPLTYWSDDSYYGSGGKFTAANAADFLANIATISADWGAQQSENPAFGDFPLAASYNENAPDEYQLTLTVINAGGTTLGADTILINVVPLPASAWSGLALLGGLGLLGGIKRLRKQMA